MRFVNTYYATMCNAYLTVLRFPGPFSITRYVYCINSRSTFHTQKLKPPQAQASTCVCPSSTPAHDPSLSPPRSKTGWTC